MTRTVSTYNEVVGFHHYPNAPEFCAYLRDRHRHYFTIRCGFLVEHNDREIEFNAMQEEIEKYIEKRYGRPAEFGARSCEDIAQELMEHYPSMESCFITEDGYGGALLTR